MVQGLMGKTKAECNMLTTHMLREFHYRKERRQIEQVQEGRGTSLV